MRKDVDVKAGVYRHYKGPLYLVLGIAHDANAGDLADYPAMMERVYAHNRGDEGVPNKPTPLGERVVVVYIGLQLDDAHTGPRLAVRTYADFFAKVHKGQPERFAEGTVCEGECHYRALNSDGLNNHLVVPRFEYLGPTWEGEH